MWQPNGLDKRIGVFPIELINPALKKREIEAGQKTQEIDGFSSRSLPVYGFSSVSTLI
jgi:hypothetical protein